MKPEKKEIPTYLSIGSDGFCKGYNQAIDDYDKYHETILGAKDRSLCNVLDENEKLLKENERLKHLPSEVEINDMLMGGMNRGKESWCVDFGADYLAKAIHKRISE